MAGAHPDVLKSLCDTNLVKSVGYGFDSYTTQAREVILKACGLEDGAVFSFREERKLIKLLLTGCYPVMTVFCVATRPILTFTKQEQ